MIKKRIVLSMMVIALLASAFTVVHEDLHQAMNKMMQKMKSMKMTGDPDKDFAGLMIEHHQGAIDAANIVVKSGKDKEIKLMAQKILSSQPQDQKDLHHLNAKHDQSHAAHAQGTSATHISQFPNEIKGIMDAMDSRMKNIKMSGNLDYDFATMILDHHEAAIALANAEIKYGTVTEVKSIAEKIKSDSQRDINELQRWKSQHDK